MTFVNGFNDSANSVATVIGTRVLRPIHAVTISAVANFAGPFIFGVAVATTIAKGIVSPDEITVYMIIGGLAGAITWSTLCTYFGLPISNSHSLIGGIMGAGIAGLGFEELVLWWIDQSFCWNSNRANWWNGFWYSFGRSDNCIILLIVNPL